jgi:uncharacterized protein
MAQPIIVAGATTESCAAVGPVQIHGARSYSRKAGYVKRWKRAALQFKRTRQIDRLVRRPESSRMPETPDDRLKSKPSLAPLEERLVALDILRGVALFGVMAINLVFEFRVSIFEQFLPLPDFASPLDHMIATFLDEAIELKAFALFSLLFGAGLAIQFDRLAGKPRAMLLLRRLLALLAFGAIHLALIWNGDILTEYALAGLLVLPFLYGPRWLLAGCSLALLALYGSSYLLRLLPFPDARWLAHHVIEARRVYPTGSFSEILRFRVHEIAAIAPFHFWVFPRTLALFLIGALVWRSGAVQRAAANPLRWFGAGLAAAVSTAFVGSVLATVTLALAYGAIIIGVASTAQGAKLLGWAAPLGRMAFTNYIVQSLIFGWIFYGYGFGLFGKLSVSIALALGVAVYTMQVFFSRWWLSRYRFGPIEWMWRSLMYGQLQPMRRSTAGATQSILRKF